MIDGIWWLVMLLAVIAALWLVAYVRGAKSNNKNNAQKLTGKKSLSNDGLQKTAVLLKQHFPDYHVSRRANHLLVTKQDKKVAMITIDNSIAIGQRRLGNVPIINYQRVPNISQLSADLQKTNQV